MSTAICVQGVSKRFRLGLIDRKLLYAGLRRLWSGGAEDDPTHKELWALKDVSFDLEEGDVLGVIGRNGSGKSTLLKILSQITAPTEGRVMIRGKVASLLEVGTGFHNELTGRDNIFLNGAVLGMSRREVASKFDEIVAFSQVEDFIDTPVKRYSSGMRVRLAFAVAAHLDPEILIIDEVLAVGDAAFQQKCIGKIGDVARQGRTVLFVSHNAAAVQSLCTRGLVLDHGRAVFDGTQTAALEHYSASRETSEGAEQPTGARSGTGDVQIVAVELRSPSGQQLTKARSGQDVEFWMHFRRTTPARWPTLCVRLHFETELGAPVFAHFNDLVRASMTGESGALPEQGVFICRCPQLPLATGLYRVESEVRSNRRAGEVLDRLTPAARISVEKGDFFGTGELPGARFGPALVSADWRMEATT